MDDELEDRIIYQTYLSHMKLLSKCAVGLPFNSTPLSYAWRVLRLYILRPEFLIFSILVVLVYLYLQTLNIWSRGLFSRFHLNLDKAQYLGTLTTDGDRLSWELKEKNVAAFAVQGRRQKMEDRFVIHEELNNTGISVFAVFDGHGGELAANYAQEHLMKSLNDKLIEVKGFQQECKKQEVEYDPTKLDINKAAEAEDVKPAASSSEKDKRLSFRKNTSSTDECAKSGKIGITDPELLRKLDSIQRPITREVRFRPASVMEKIPLSSYLDSSKFSGINYGKIITDEVIAADKKLVEKAKKTMDVAGTTALIALLEDDHLIVANVGDSRGVMCDSKGNAIPLSFDHKPQQIKERNRIRDAGGFISFNGVWRVAGILATSRALGDYPLKEKKLVIPDPDILTFNLTDHKPMFMVLASDGLWDTFTNEEAISFIKERLNEPHYGAKSITLQSYYRGSLDNITVMVINFRDRKWGDYSSKKTS